MDKILNLYEAKESEQFFVVSTPSIDLLENIGIRQGMQVTVEHRYAFGGPVLLRVEGAYSVALGKDIAQLIFVIKNELEKETNNETGQVAV